MRVFFRAQRVIRLLLSLCMSVAVFSGAAGLVACSEGVPKVVGTKSIVSPSKQYVATVEVVDNGLGFGLGALYDEVHVTSATHWRYKHGDADETVAYYSESTYGGAVPQVEWVGADRLRITIDANSEPVRQLNSVSHVLIEYSKRLSSR